MQAFHLAHLDALLKLDQDCSPYPWSANVMRSCLQGANHCWGEGDTNRIEAAIWWLQAPGELQILNICVTPQYRRQGKASRLLQWAEQQACQHADIDSIFLEVRQSNHAAIALYQAHQFVEVGTRVGYYPSATGNTTEREDAILMAKSLFYHL